MTEARSGSILQPCSPLAGRRSLTSISCATKPVCWGRWPRRRRGVDEVTPAALQGAGKARAGIPQHVWVRLPAVPASKVAGTDLGGVVVLDADAPLVTAHSEKDQARATFKGGYGFHPIGGGCDKPH